MIRHLIAEDELEIRKGISKAVNLGKFDIEMVGEIRGETRGIRSTKEKKVYTVLSKERFMREWVNGKVSTKELRGKMEYYDIPYSKEMGIIVIKLLEKKDSLKKNSGHRELLSYAVANITKDIIKAFSLANVFVDDKMQIVIISDTNPIIKWQELSIDLENNINKYLNIDVAIDGAFLRKDPIETNIVYKLICNRLYERSRKTAIVLDIERYVNRNYKKQSISLGEIAEILGINQTYISRLFKKEMGMTFSSYITNIRIKNSIILMRDSSLEISEIAEMVGYSAQSYFSNVFKKSVGISPSDYRAGLNSGQA